jgi:hypothetical protein
VCGKPCIIASGAVTALLQRALQRQKTHCAHHKSVLRCSSACLYMHRSLFFEVTTAPLKIRLQSTSHTHVLPHFCLSYAVTCSQTYYTDILLVRAYSANRPSHSAYTPLLLLLLPLRARCTQHSAGHQHSAAASVVRVESS